MPTGDLDGWTQVFTDDFTTDVAEDSFPDTAYADRWDGYNGDETTYGTGQWATAETVSVHDGVMDQHLRAQDGTALAAAPYPLLDGSEAGQQYGRYSVRFQADTVAGYKMAWLLWPDSDDWNEGEVDFPEGDVGGDTSAFVHCLGNPATNCYDADAGTTSGGWHTATTEWTPSGITFWMDDQQVGHTDVSPTASMHWVLQTEPGETTPPASADGHILIDWVAAWSAS